MRLIDADALAIDYYDDYETKDDIYTYAYVSEVQIDSAPSIDIVRCGECKRANHELSGVYCGISNVLMGEDGFCSIGEREGE